LLLETFVLLHSRVVCVLYRVLFNVLKLQESQQRRLRQKLHRHWLLQTGHI